MAPGFELMGWLKQAGSQAATSAEGPPPAQPSSLPAATSPAPQAASSSSAPGGPGRIVAPHSQAAAALAAALSGGVPGKKQPQPHGTQISPLQEVLEVDRIRPESAPTLVVSKIANVKSEISRRHGHAIAVDANYICYGLKGGQIRILNKYTGARMLLKDHAAPVTDLRFFRHVAERCLLASVDTTGQVHVRTVYEGDTGEEDTVRDEILARHELPMPITGPGAHPPACLAWHPTYDFVLAVAVGPTIYFINVPPTPDVAAAPEYAAPVAAASSAEGAAMTSVAFSPEGDLLAAGDANGYVYVWALTPEQFDPALIQQLAPEPDIRFQAYGSAPGEVPYGGDGAAASAAAIASLHWLPRRERDAAAGTAAGGSDSGSSAPLALLTGDGMNAHLKLWRIDLSSKPQCTHALRLASAAPAGGASGSSSSTSALASSSAFFNHLETQPLYDCVVLTNELRGNVYVLHVDLDSQPYSPFFDYASEFSVKLPILSCTLVPETFIDEATDAEAFHLYTIQPDAVQQYTVVPAQCFPSAAAAAAAGTPSLGASGASASAAGGGTSHAGTAVPAPSKDPLAVLLALQHQQLLEREREGQKVEGAGGLAAPPHEASSVGAVVPPPMSRLLSAPSDMSDATSPPLPLAAGASSTPVVVAAAPGGEEVLAAEAPSAAAAAAAGEEVEQRQEVDATLGAAATVDAEVAAVTATLPLPTSSDEQLEEVAESSTPAPAAAAVAPPVEAPRPSLLLTPSQLMQSAAAAAAAAARAVSFSGSTANGSCGGAGGAAADGSAAGFPAGAPAGAGRTEDAYSIMATAGGDDESIGSAAEGTSRAQSLEAMSNMTPSMSDANLAAVAAAASADAEAEAAEAEAEAAEAEAEAAEADAAEAVASVAALPVNAGTGLVPVPPPMAVAQLAPTQQQSPVVMPPLPSEHLVRRVSQTKSGGLSPAPSGSATRPQSAPPPPLSLSPSASGTVTVPIIAVAAAPAAELGSPAPPPAVAAPAPATALLDAQAQQQLTQLLTLQQQLLNQVSSGQRDLLKAVKAEAQKSSKAAAEAAATKAAEAVARKAAEERRRESAELLKALTAAINGVTKDVAQRVADAAAATTAAVKAAIGPAVRAAVAEALPAALSAGATATALERALGSQLTASLPRAVADGLGAAFTAQVVPPLERATSTMFGQMETALRSGLDAHLGPLAPLGGLSSQLRDAAAQVATAAKSLKIEAVAAQQAAATASRAAAAAASSAAATATAAVAAVAPPVSAAAAAPAAPAPAPKSSSSKLQSAATAAASAAAPAGSSRQGGADAASSSSSTAPVLVQAATSRGASGRTAQQQAPAAPPAQPAVVGSSPPAGRSAGPVGTIGTPIATPQVAPGPVAAASPATSTATSAIAGPPPAPPTIDAATRDQVLALLRSGDLDGALSRVLERQDLSLVLWACGAAGGASVLAAEPCPLGQPILLSLLTFLSYDLTADVDLKLGWIDAILKRLDVREPGLAPHIRGVLDSVKAALAVIARGGTGPTAAKAKQAVHQAIGLIAMLS